jgi:DNA-directed RNA polymerase subunit D
MEVETVEETEDVLKVEISDINEVIANSLRRSMMIKVPTLSVQELTLTKNGSALIDEVLANRIGQVPFTVPQNVEEEDTVHIALKQEGPGTVLAEDLQADNDEAEPVNPEAVLVDLKEDQAVELEAEAELGRGEEHAKHQGGTIGYEKKDEGVYEFRIESTSGYTNEELLEKGVQEIKNQLDEFGEAVAEI